MFQRELEFPALFSYAQGYPEEECQQRWRVPRAASRKEKTFPTRLQKRIELEGINEHENSIHGMEKHRAEGFGGRV